MIKNKEVRINNAHKKKIERVKDITSILFIVILLTQALLFGQVKNLGNSILDNLNHTASYSTDIDTAFIQDTIRPQERRMLNAVRQGWVQYLETNPNTELLIKDNNGNYIMKCPEGSSFIFNPNTMVQIPRSDNYFDIKYKGTDEILMEKVRPQWNSDEVKKILDIVASPIKAFGATGDVLVFDAYTGEILIDNSLDSSNAPEIIGEDGKRYVQLLYLHPNDKNQNAVKTTIETQLMWRKDSDSTSNIVNYFNEPTDMGSEGSNFTKYPLGQYNRDFQEKILLPYEAIGVEGQAMQITIVISAEEQEIYAPYKVIKDKMQETQTQLKNDAIVGVFAPMASIFLSLIVIFLAMYALRLSMFFGQKAKKEREQEKL